MSLNDSGGYGVCGKIHRCLMLVLVSKELGCKMPQIRIFATKQGNER
jgi:hypothetical protein